MKAKKKLFLKKVTISNLSGKHMNELRGGSNPPCVTASRPYCDSREAGFCPNPLTISYCNTECADE
jgi:hypothetical protein